MLEEDAAKMLLNTGFAVRARSGASLANVINMNYAKLSARVKANRIDHSDGERGKDLL